MSYAHKLRSLYFIRFAFAIIWVGVMFSTVAMSTEPSTLLTGLLVLYPAFDGHVSITLLFGTMIGPFSKRLMEWVHEEGLCDRAMLDWDWEAFGIRLLASPVGPGELEQVKAAITQLTSRRTKAELFAEYAGRSTVAVAPGATDVADAELARRIVEEERARLAEPAA